jgi:hypothetical protein
MVVVVVVVLGEQEMLVFLQQAVLAESVLM